ncbi:hypothetical protein ACLOJK_004916 [Asimina triloba]
MSKINAEGLGEAEAMLCDFHPELWKELKDLEAAEDRWASLMVRVQVDKLGEALSIALRAQDQGVVTLAEKEEVQRSLGRELVVAREARDAALAKAVGSRHVAVEVDALAKRSVDQTETLKGNRTISASSSAVLPATSQVVPTPASPAIANPNTLTPEMDLILLPFPPLFASLLVLRDPLIGADTSSVDTPMEVNVKYTKDERDLLDDSTLHRRLPVYVFLFGISILLRFATLSAIFEGLLLAHLFNLLPIMMLIGLGVRIRIDLLRYFDKLEATEAELQRIAEELSWAAKGQEDALAEARRALSKASVVARKERKEMHAKAYCHRGRVGEA